METHLKALQRHYLVQQTETKIRSARAESSGGSGRHADGPAAARRDYAVTLSSRATRFGGPQTEHRRLRQAADISRVRATLDSARRRARRIKAGYRTMLFVERLPVRIDDDAAHRVGHSRAKRDREIAGAVDRRWRGRERRGPDRASRRKRLGMAARQAPRYIPARFASSVCPPACRVSTASASISSARWIVAPRRSSAGFGGRQERAARSRPDGFIENHERRQRFIERRDRIRNRYAAQAFVGESPSRSDPRRSPPTPRYPAPDTATAIRRAARPRIARARRTCPCP